MELLQLRYFCDAAETQSFTITAAKFLVPASNISQRIRALEKELGVSLFVRHANRVSLAPAGMEFYKKASAALTLLDDAVTNARIPRKSLRICVNSNRRISISAMEAFKHKHPDVALQVEFSEDPTAEKDDVILSVSNARLLNMPCRLLGKEQMCLAVSTANPLASAETIDRDLLSAQPFLAFNEKSGLAAMTHRICNDFGFSPNIVLETDDTMHLRKCVQLGFGVAIVSRLAWGGDPTEGVTLLPLEGYYRTSYIYLPNGETSELITDFIDCVMHLPEIMALESQ